MGACNSCNSAASDGSKNKLPESEKLVKNPVSEPTVKNPFSEDDLVFSRPKTPPTSPPITSPLRTSPSKTPPPSRRRYRDALQDLLNLNNPGDACISQLCDETLSLFQPVSQSENRKDLLDWVLARAEQLHRSEQDPAYLAWMQAQNWEDLENRLPTYILADFEAMRNEFAACCRGAAVRFNEKSLDLGDPNQATRILLTVSQRGAISFNKVVAKVFETQRFDRGLKTDVERIIQKLGDYGRDHGGREAYKYFKDLVRVRLTFDSARGVVDAFDLLARAAQPSLEAAKGQPSCFVILEVKKNLTKSLRNLNVVIGTYTHERSPVIGEIQLVARHGAPNKFSSSKVHFLYELERSLKSSDSECLTSQMISEFYNCVNKIEPWASAAVSYYAGIDLGTSNSGIAEIVNGVPINVEITGEKSCKLPSSVQFNFSKRTVTHVGTKAETPRKEAITLYDSKRFLGRKANAEEVKAIRAMNLPFPIVADEHGNSVYRVINAWQPGGSYYNLSPGVVSKELLKHLANDFRAKHHIEGSFKAVITVPANFTSSQRNATQQAAQDAGIEVLRLVPEPVAAAVAHLEPQRKRGVNIDGNHLVFDFGGGTHDVSVVNVQGKHYNVLATEGDTLLGGRDVDKLVLDILEEFLMKAKFDLHVRDDDTSDKRLRKQAWARKLRAHATYLKEELSIKAEVDTECDGLFDGEECPSYVLKREKLEDVMQQSGMMHRLLAPVHSAMAGKVAADFQSVMLTGGSSRIPIVQKAMRSLFGEKVSSEGNFDHAVAHGAALLAASHSDIVDGNDLVLKDILSLSLGIKVKGDIMSPILSKGMEFPCEVTSSYQTTDDNQTAVEIAVYQGEAQQASSNQFINRYMFSGLPRLPAGKVVIDVKFSMDAGGVLEVSVFDKTNAFNKAKFQVDVKKVGELSNQDEGMDLVQDKNLAAALDSLTKAVYNAEYTASQYGDSEQRARAQQMLRDSGLMTFIHEASVSEITMEEIDRRLADLNQYMTAHSPASPVRPLRPDAVGTSVSPVVSLSCEVAVHG